MKFYCIDISIDDRHIEPTVSNIPTGHPMPPKHEEITLTVRLIGSGDTRNFNSLTIMRIIMDKISEIFPK